MKLKNEALQILYDTIVNCTIAISPYADSPMDKAFEDCDEKLSDQLSYFTNSRDDWRSRARHEEEEKIEQVKRADSLSEQVERLRQDHESDVRVIGKLHSQMVDLEDEKTEQEKRADILKSQRDMLKKEIEQLKKDKRWLEQSRLEWARRAVKRGKELNEANEKNQDLKKDRDIWFRKNGEKLAEIAELKNRLDKANYDRTSLQKNLDYYMDICKKVQDDYDELHRKYSECQGTVDKQAEQIRNLKAKQDSVRKNCYDQGQTDLWVKLQDVKDMQPNEFDVECECLGDVIDMDLEDFLDEYKKWQEDIKKTYEQKETDRMREWLVDFCWGRVCEGCPLESKEYKCGCGYSFRKTDPSDLRIIPDKDIKRYYEKARGCGLESIKAACDAFTEGLKAGLASEVKEVPVSCDIPIKDLASWECTLEANVEVNKDLLNKVCGIKPEGLVITTRGVTTANYSEATMNAIKEAVRKFEKSLPALDSWESTITGSIKVDDILGKTDGTEHKFEYGDAVRLPWRDYDYMYIGQDKRGDGKMIRLFDPKNHSVAYVSSNEHLDIRGYKIIIGNEEDLRKIWCDKE